MMLIGIAAAHIGKYADASSSFTLVRQLFEVNSKRNKCEIKSEMVVAYTPTGFFRARGVLPVAQLLRTERTIAAFNNIV
jgi:hypothetical protein